MGNILEMVLEKEPIMNRLYVCHACGTACEQRDLTFKGTYNNRYVEICIACRIDFGDSDAMDLISIPELKRIIKEDNREIILNQ
jgi:formylmethanofuran dehydrogenase subunit B